MALFIIKVADPWFRVYLDLRVCVIGVDCPSNCIGMLTFDLEAFTLSQIDWLPPQ